MGRSLGRPLAGGGAVERDPCDRLAVDRDGCGPEAGCVVELHDLDGVAVAAQGVGDVGDCLPGLAGARHAGSNGDCEHADVLHGVLDVVIEGLGAIG